MTTLSEPPIKAAREPAAKRHHIKVAALPGAKKKVDARTKAFLDAVMALKLWGKCAFCWHQCPSAS